MREKISHIANHCQEKSMLEYSEFLAYRPGRSSRPADLANRLGHMLPSI